MSKLTDYMIVKYKLIINYEVMFDKRSAYEEELQIRKIYTSATQTNSRLREELKWQYVSEKIPK